MSPQDSALSPEYAIYGWRGEGAGRIELEMDKRKKDDRYRAEGNRRGQRMI